MWCSPDDGVRHNRSHTHDLTCPPLQEEDLPVIDTAPQPPVSRVSSSKGLRLASSDSQGSVGHPSPAVIQLSSVRRKKILDEKFDASLVTDYLRKNRAFAELGEDELDALSFGMIGKIYQPLEVGIPLPISLPFLA